MKNLPTPVKWLLLLLAFVGIFAILGYTNWLSSQGRVPPPESWMRPALSAESTQG